MNQLYKKIINGILLAAAGLGLFHSCYYDKKEVLYPNRCDTIMVTYTTDIKPILEQSSCLTQGCHAGPDSQAGINLENYTATKSAAQALQLFHAVDWTGLPDNKKMPQGGQRLSQCSIDKIKAWTNQGMNE